MRTINDLNHDELVEVKRNYLERLDLEGCLNEVLFNRPEDDDDPDKCLDDEMLDRADDLVPDDVVIDRYADQEFGDTPETLWDIYAEPCEGCDGEAEDCAHCGESNVGNNLVNLQ